MDVRDEIKHIVVLMLENCSLDNVLGWLYAPDNRPQRNIPRENVPNFDGLVANSSHFWNSLTPESPDGKPFVWATKGVTKSPNEQPNPCPQEDYASFLEQMFGFDPFETGHAGQPMRADMGGFPKNYARADEKAPERIMESIEYPVLVQFPGHRPFAQHIEHGSFAPVESQVWHFVIVLTQLVAVVEASERGAGVHEGSVGPGFAWNRTEPAVANGELFGQMSKHRNLVGRKRLGVACSGLPSLGTAAVY